MNLIIYLIHLDKIQLNLIVNKNLFNMLKILVIWDKILTKMLNSVFFFFKIKYINKKF
jgi:hypothetical protein